MAQISPLRQRMIEDLTIRNLSLETKAILRASRVEVQPVFWPIA